MVTVGVKGLINPSTELVAKCNNLLIAILILTNVFQADLS